MSRSTFALALVLLGACGATTSQPLPPVAPARAASPPSARVDNDAASTQQHDDACANSAAPSSVDACAADAQCRLCHDGSACGTAVTAATLSARGAACAQPDTADCESLVVRCCEGHCRYVAF